MRDGLRFDLVHFMIIKRNTQMQSKSVDTLAGRFPLIIGRSTQWQNHSLAFQLHHRTRRS
jgi:hypothetical protein